MNLTTLSTEQLNAYLHEVEWILNQLSDIRPHPDLQQLFNSVEDQTIVIQERLTLERARRSLVHLQAQLLVEDRLCPYCREQGIQAPSELQIDETFLAYLCPNKHTFYVKREDSVDAS